MRIGIDLDDTICRTTEMVHEKMDEYSAKTHRDVLEIMSSELIREKFFEEYLPTIYREVVIKHDVKDVIRRLRNKGNEIFIISGRKRYKINDVMYLSDEALESVNETLQTSFNYSAFPKKVAFLDLEIEAKGEKGTYKTVYDKLTCLQINGKWYIQTSAIDIFEDELQEE